MIPTGSGSGYSQIRITSHSQNIKWGDISIENHFFLIENPQVSQSVRIGHSRLLPRRVKLFRGRCPSFTHKRRPIEPRAGASQATNEDAPQEHKQIPMVVYSVIVHRCMADRNVHICHSGRALLLMRGVPSSHERKLLNPCDPAMQTAMQFQSRSTPDNDFTTPDNDFRCRAATRWT